MATQQRKLRAPTREVGLNILHVVLKVAERCNLVCPYCYFFFNGDETYKRHPAVMPMARIKDTAQFLRRAVLENGYDSVRLVFHGGEPLLVKKAVFRAMCDVLTDALDDVCNLLLGVQTNGVLIDEEWVDIFEEYRIRIGVSFDGVGAQHDLTRIDKKGRGTYDQTKSGWDLLMRAAEEGRLSRPGLLCVVAPEQDGGETLMTFLNELGPEGVNFLLPDYTHDSAEVTPELIEKSGEYMLSVLRRWIALGRPALRVRFIMEAFGPLVDDGIARRTIVAKNNPLVLLTISSNGDISPDDTLRGIGPRFQDTGLNVSHSTIGEVFTHPLWRDLVEAHEKPGGACGDCKWWNACKGGMQLHRHSHERGLANESIYCGALKKFHAEVANLLTDAGYSASEMDRRMSASFARETFSLLKASQENAHVAARA